MEAVYLLELIDESFARVESHYRCLLSELEEAEIHDFRVAIRKVMPIIELAMDIEEESRGEIRLRENYSRLKSYFKDFSDLRDIQVQIISVSAYKGLEGYAEELKLEEEKLKDSIGQKIELWSVEEVRSSLESALKSTFEGMDSPELVRHYMRRAKVLRKKFLKRIKELNEDYSSYHKLRLALKKYRYHMEMAGSDGLDEVLKRYQDELGHIQDLTVLLEDIRRRGRVKEKALRGIEKERARAAEKFRKRYLKNLKARLKIEGH